MLYYNHAPTQQQTTVKKELTQAIQAMQSIFCKMTPPLTPNPFSNFRGGALNTKYITLPHLTTQYTKRYNNSK